MQPVTYKIDLPVWSLFSGYNVSLNPKIVFLAAAGYEDEIKPA